MDHLRTAYTTDFKWAADDPYTSRVRWYRAPSGASIFPGPHRFGSTIWSRQINVESAFGERLASPKVYDKGATPADIHGSNFCGQANWGQDGVPVLSTPIRSRLDGQPCCCASTGPPLSVACPGRRLSTCLTFTATHLTGTCAPIGSFSLPLNWDGVDWVVDTVFNGIPVSLAFTETGDPQPWQLASLTGNFGVLQGTQTSCLPFSVTYPAVPVAFGCLGTADLTVSEYPP